MKLRKLFTIPGIVIVSVLGVAVMVCLAAIKCVDLTWSWVCDEWNS